MKLKSVILLVMVAFFLAMCSRETDTTADSGDNTDISENNGVIAVYELTVPGDMTWIKTGIVMDPGIKVRITANDRNLAMGDPIGRRFDPVKLFGHGGLIAKIGEEGVPFAVGVEKEVQGSSLSMGKYLYLGRNITLAMPSGSTASVMDVYTPATDTTEVEPLATIKSFLQPVDVVMEVSHTDAPAPLAPVDDFWLEDQSPTFDWDDVDNAVQYIFEVSQFPDFRSVYLSINSVNSSVNTATINNTQQIIPNPNQEEQAVFAEGVYYWRVRAQLNIGRTLAPEFKWSERSVVWKFGIEQRIAIDPPEILNPKPEEEFAENSNVLIDFLAPPDGSGLLWRIKFYHAECGKVINTDEIPPEKVLLWRVFQTTVDSDVINQPPRNYGYYLANSLDRGEWVFVVQLRDGADPDGKRIAYSKVHITVGCNR